jgi:glutathionylspermidine synthase
MDFKKLREYTKECDMKLDRLSEEYEIDIKYLKRLCQEMGFQTQYTYYEAIELVACDLFCRLDINKIILKYGLDKGLI